MPFLGAFGAYLPIQAVSNAELASRLGCTPQWILEVSGIEERRYAADQETVVDMAVAAAKACLARAAMPTDRIGMLLVSSGSSGCQFPGPASQVAAALGLTPKPALDIPMASAGGLFAIALADRLASTYGNILVVAAEKMSEIALREPLDKNTSILFGDGAGACVVSPESGEARIVDFLLHSDGAFAADLQLDHSGPLRMKGLSVIMQASRKIPSVLRELLERNGRSPSEIEVFLMHQANQNLINRVARALDVPANKFFSNIRAYGNTSSASMLIAAADWWQDNQPVPGAPICLAAFGAGFHWGAVLAESTTCRR